MTGTGANSEKNGRSNSIKESTRETVTVKITPRITTGAEGYDKREEVSLAVNDGYQLR